MPIILGFHDMMLLVIQDTAERQGTRQFLGVFDAETHSANQFTQFFSHKIETIRKDTENCRATTTVCPHQAVVRSARPWRQHRRPAHHGRPRRRITPVVPVSVTPAMDGQIFPDVGGCEDTGARIRQQPS